MIFMARDEFKCHCCGANEINPDLIEMLDKARGLAGIPFKITSGYRCRRHNTEIGSKSDVHVNGQAADIYADGSRPRYKIINALIAVGFNRIGVGADFIHCDIDTTKAPFVMWDYYG